MHDLGLASAVTAQADAHVAIRFESFVHRHDELGSAVGSHQGDFEIFGHRSKNFACSIIDFAAWSTWSLISPPLIRCPSTAACDSFCAASSRIALARMRVLWTST